MMRWILHIALLFTVLMISCHDKDMPEDHSQHVHPDTVKVLTASPSEIVASSQRTIKPSQVSLASTARFNGYIAADEKRNNNVSARVGGRIEKLHTKITYQYINKGNAVLDIYSPDLNTAAEEYLLLYKAGTHGTLLERSREKLKLLGLSEKQITSIEQKRTVPLTFTVFSTYSGYLLPGDETMQQENNDTGESSSDMDKMNSTRTSGESYSSTVIREGAYVNEGQTLLKVNDLQQVWGLVLIDAGIQVEEGDSILIRIGDQNIRTSIGFIEPFYKQGQKFIRARIYLDNSKGQYKLNDLFTAELLVGQERAVLAVPGKSILDLGQRKIVWVKTGTIGKNNLFEARTVTTGKASNDYVEILSGLAPDEEIAETAGFMIDRESLIEK